MAQDYNVLVINPGSTSTKIALFTNGEDIWNHTIKHSADELAPYSHINDELPMRLEMITHELNRHKMPKRIDAVIARGGLCRPTPGGIYKVEGTLREDLLNSEFQHACNLGGLLAEKLAEKYDCQALIADPEVVDELSPEARMTGLPAINRISIFHALNTKAVARRYAESVGRKYEDLNLIVAHIGGGISVGAHYHGKVIDVNNALNGDGPFSPQRAGSLPAAQLVDLCFSNRYSKPQIMKMLNGEGGLVAHLGSSDVNDIEKKARHGDEKCKSVLDSMLYHIACEIGARAAALSGDVDAIILTGGIAHSDYCVESITRRIKFIAPVIVRAGEDELESLAQNAFRLLNGKQDYAVYPY
ncbi:MAG: butyrate kinase [Paramuribaculum sp.]|nr:butyrate kinase [Paramuribaculum sp.]